MTSAKHRRALPQTGGDLFLTDGGLETTLIFHRRLDLPYFAAFELVATEKGRPELIRYFAPYFEIARRDGRGLILDTPTWRANPDWAAKLGHSAAVLDALNAQAAAFVRSLRDANEALGLPIVLSGVVGPRGDGYDPQSFMTVEETQAYHAPQIAVFAEGGVDFVSAMTMTYLEEAVGVVQAAQAAGMPACISFTVETDGRLPTGMALAEAVAGCDAATGGQPAYYMINCAHPSHFMGDLDGGTWTARIGGLRANASRMSHAELDQSETLDDGDPQALAADYRALAAALPNLRVLGGCCGTDHRHVEAISGACGHAHAA